jgi:predicted DNA-binding antitoxin AbrB/MazE fold protein
METSVSAVYRNGVFVPLSECHFPENTRVEVSVKGHLVIEPEITDPEEKKRYLKEVVARMQQNPVPLDAPRFTRDELHERR